MALVLNVNENCRPAVLIVRSTPLADAGLHFMPGCAEFVDEEVEDRVLALFFPLCLSPLRTRWARHLEASSNKMGLRPPLGFRLSAAEVFD